MDDEQDAIDGLAIIEVMEAIDELIDARIEYARGDPDWRSTRDAINANTRLARALIAWKGA